MKNKNYALISTAVILLLWWGLAALVKDAIKIPSPGQTLIALGEIMSSRVFMMQVLGTLKRTMAGFIIAFLLGLILGILAGSFAPIYYLLRPIILAQRSVPTMAVILLTLIWLNRRDIAPILVSVIIIFPIIYGAVVNGVRDIDKKLLEMAQIYHLNRRKRLIHLYMPSIGTGLRSISAAAISLNLKVTIAAEVLSQPGNAIGTGFQVEKMALNTAGVLAWAIVAILLGWCLETLVNLKILRFIKTKMTTHPLK